MYMCKVSHKRDVNKLTIYFGELVENHFSLSTRSTVIYVILLKYIL